MSQVIFYHAHCTDGFGAAYAAWLQLGDSATYIPVAYGDVKTVEDLRRLIPAETQEVHVLDFSFDPEITSWIIANYKFVWLDHHVSAINTWGAYAETSAPSTAHIKLSIYSSGAKLAWQHYHPDKPLPDLIKYIDDRDRWVFYYPQSRSVHAGLATLKPWSFAQWHNVASNLSESIQIGYILTQEVRRNVIGQAKRAHPCTVLGIKGYHVNATVNHSELGGEIAKQHQTFALVWSYSGDTGKAQCSFRSVGDLDVSAIAKAFGGGGHRNAAGCNVPMDTLLSWLC